MLALLVAAIPLAAVFAEEQAPEENIESVEAAADESVDSMEEILVEATDSTEL